MCRYGQLAAKFLYKGSVFVGLLPANSMMEMGRLNWVANGVQGMQQCCRVWAAGNCHKHDLVRFDKAFFRNCALDR